MARDEVADKADQIFFNLHRTTLLFTFRLIERKSWIIGLLSNLRAIHKRVVLATVVRVA